MTNGPPKVNTALLKKALTPDRICTIDAAAKNDALRTMIDCLATSSSIVSRDELAEAVFKREELMSTGIGLGLAVPHVRLESVRDVTMAVGIAREEIADYASLDDKPVRLIFMIAAPADQHTQYLRLLAAISTQAKNLNGHLLDCTDTDEFYRLFVGDAGGTDTTQNARD